MLFSIRGFTHDTTEQEILEKLEEFGAQVTKITLEPGNQDSTNVALIDVDTDATGIKVLVEAIDGHIWKGRRLHAHPYLFGQ